MEAMKMSDTIVVGRRLNDVQNVDLFHCSGYALFCHSVPLSIKFEE